MSKNAAFSFLSFVFYFLWTAHQVDTDPDAFGLGVGDIWAGALFLAGAVSGICFIVCAIYRHERPFVLRAVLAGLAAASAVFLLRLGTAADIVPETSHQAAITFGLPVLYCTLTAEAIVILFAFVSNPSRSFIRALV